MIQAWVTFNKRLWVNFDERRRVLEGIEHLAIARDDATGVPTGFAHFDCHTGGLQPENFIVLAGQTGVGKTAWALNVAAHASLRVGVPTLVFSLELSKTEVEKRLLTAAADMDVARLRRGLVDWKNKIRPAGARLKGVPLVIDDTIAPTLESFRIKLQRFLADRSLFARPAEDQRALVILDRIQRVKPNITRGLKNLAKEFRVAFVAVSTLNRAFERREDKRPRLTDLRGSGSIEDHADVVLFLHRQAREETWGADCDERSTTLIIAKHRSSPTRDFNLSFIAERLRFEEQTETVPY